MTKNKACQTAIARFIRDRRPNLFIRLQRNMQIDRAGALNPGAVWNEVKAFLERVNFELFGPLWRKMPSSETIEGVVIVEKIEASPHFHLAIRVPRAKLKGFHRIVNFRVPSEAVVSPSLAGPDVPIGPGPSLSQVPTKKALISSLPGRRAAISVIFLAATQFGAPAFQATVSGLMASAAILAFISLRVMGPARTPLTRTAGNAGLSPR